MSCDAVFPHFFFFFVIIKIMFLLDVITQKLVIRYDYNTLYSFSLCDNTSVRDIVILFYLIFEMFICRHLFNEIIQNLADYKNSLIQFWCVYLKSGCCNTIFSAFSPFFLSCFSFFWEGYYSTILWMDFHQTEHVRCTYRYIGRVPGAKKKCNTS